MSKEKKGYWLEILLFLVLLYGTTISVFLNGDDFMYGTFAHQGILQSVWGYYHTGNGRFWINILDSVLLWFDRYLFIVVTPWIVLSLVWLMARNLEMILGYDKNEEKHRTFMKYGMVLFACMDVMCLRETVYWITGMMNYLFPAVVFLFGYFCFQKSRNGLLNGWQKFFYFVICFLAASSAEQYALMFVGMMTLHHIYDLIQKKKIPAYEWAAYLVALLGLAFLVLAPGNFVRVDVQAEEQLSFIDNVWTLVINDTLESPAFPYYLILNLLLLFKVKPSKRYVQIVAMTFVSALLLINAIPELHKAIIYLGVFFLSASLFVYTLIKRRFEFIVYALAFVGIGSQLMLLISAIWGFRCMFSLYVVYMMIIIVLLDSESDNRQKAILLTGITCSIHPVLTLCYWAISGLGQIVKHQVFSSSFKKNLIVLFSAAAMISVCIGYGSNVSIYRGNLAATHSKQNSITLKSVPEFEYSWYHMPLSEFHENYYKQYYGIENTVIQYDTDSVAP